MAAVHVLKSWPGNFDAILRRTRLAELRVLDRDFKAGDFIRLREWNPDLPHGAGVVDQRYTGREALVRIVGIEKPIPVENEEAAGLISFLRVNEKLEAFRLASSDPVASSEIEEQITGERSTILDEQGIGRDVSEPRTIKGL